MRTIDRSTAFKRDYKRETKGQHRATLDTDLMAITVFKAIDKPNAKAVSAELNEGVNEGVNALLKTIKQQPGLRVPALAERMTTSAKNLERWLKQLKESGQIEFRGASKTGGYLFGGRQMSLNVKMACKEHILRSK
jgi:DNA-binding transcriptional regulator YiaG